MQRTTVSSGAPWEAIVGYSRACRIGPYVAVTGTVGIGPDGGPIAPDGYRQARRALEIIADALSQAGASLSDVIRTRIFVVNIDDWQEIGRAHAEVFGQLRPATTMVEIRRLIAPGFLVEIEADAVVGDR